MTNNISSITLPANIALPSFGNFSSYVRAVMNIPHLSPEREKELLNNWNKKKDPLAAKELVLSHLHLVVKIVRDHQGYGLSQEDLCQEGTVGLMKAVQKFDLKKGVRLGTYAWYWIEAEIREFILKNWRLVSWGTSTLSKKLFFGYRKTIRSLKGMGENRPLPSIQDISQSLGVSEQDAILTHDYFFGADIELVDEQSELEESASFKYETILKSEHSPDIDIEEKQYSQSVSQMIAVIPSLSDRHKEVIQGRFLTSPPITLSKLSKTMNVSIERVRQIEQDALRSMRLMLEKQKDNHV